MSNRYVTEAEREGARQRSRAYQDRLREAGFTPRQMWLNNPENERIRQILKRWRGEQDELSTDLAEAADALKPTETK